MEMFGSFTEPFNWQHQQLIHTNTHRLKHTQALTHRQTRTETDRQTDTTEIKLSKCVKSVRTLKKTDSYD